MSIPARMKALLLKEGGFSTDYSRSANMAEIAPYVELGETDVPVVGPGQVLIKVKLSTFNPSDAVFIRGFYGQPRVQGDPAGFEGVGHVVAAKGLYGKTMMNKRVAFVATGAWAEYAIADAATVIKLRSDIRDEDGAALVVNPMTALAMVDMVPEGGAFIATAASSQLGKLMAGVAADTGKRMIAIARRDEPLENLKTLGAHTTLNETDADFEAKLRAVVKAERPTILLDAVTGPVPAMIFSAMPKDSRWVIYGRLSAAATEITDPGSLIFQRKVVEGFWLVHWMAQAPIWRKLKIVKRAQEMFASGKWQTDVTDIIPFVDAIDDLPAALEKVDGKAMISFE